ncbi:MAG: anti-sigma factor family protein [Endomicrobiales bacterium]
MNCTDFKKEIMLFHSGELPGERKAVLDNHLQLCPECACFNHEVAVAAGAFRDGRLSERRADLWPGIRARISPRPFSLPRWVLAPALSLAMICTLMTDTSFRVPRAMDRAEMEVVEDLEFLSDYDLWEDLETLENMELSS